MTDETTSRLLGRFVGAVQPVVPLVSVWAHGSLAGGDYQPGRSDLDLIAILGRPCTAAEEQQLREAHENLESAVALASRLHCSYCAAGELGDPARLHLTWAHEEFMRRPVTPVTRRELHNFGLVLYGGTPAALLPPVTGEQLAEFVVQDHGHIDLRLQRGRVRGRPGKRRHVLRGGAEREAWLPPAGEAEFGYEYTMKIIGGSLPPGLQLSLPSTAWTITGTPTKAGTYPFTVQITPTPDAGGGPSGNQQLTITIGTGSSDRLVVTAGGFNGHLFRLNIGGYDVNISALYSVSVTSTGKVIIPAQANSASRDGLFELTEHPDDPCGQTSCSLTVTDSLGSSVTITIPPPIY